MYRQSLRFLWIQARWVMLSVAVICFSAPLLTVYLGTSPRANGGEVAAWLLGAERVGNALPVLAFVVGMIMGIMVWTADRTGNHVYALSLPLRRARFIGLRFAAGATLLAVPAAAMGLGTLLATMSVSLPVGIHAYPVALTARFAMATLLSFALFFAFAIATRRVALTLLAVAAASLLVDVVSGMLLEHSFNVSLRAAEILVTWPGPLAILTGRWALFDV